MNSFTIKDLENLTGIKAHTIRIWEQRYSFLKPSRTDTNIRLYSCEELKSILNIALLNKYGYKISHIDKMQHTEICEKLVSINNIQAQQERVINELIKYMIDFDMDNFENILDTNINAKGVDKTITQIIFPFLEKIGILWLTNHINPAQEHLVSNIIRQKLIVGIESAFTHISSKTTVLLFLPEGEHHELGLLYAYYMMKSRGIKTIYLGANVPLKDVEFVVKLKHPDILYTHITSVTHHFNLEKFFAQLHTKANGIKTVVSGQQAQQYKKKLQEGIEIKKSLQEVQAFIAAMS